MKSVYGAVRTGSLYQAVCASSLKGKEPATCPAIALSDIEYVLCTAAACN